MPCQKWPGTSALPPCPAKLAGQGRAKKNISTYFALPCLPCQYYLNILITRIRNSMATLPIWPGRAGQKFFLNILAGQGRARFQFGRAFPTLLQRYQLIGYNVLDPSIIFLIHDIGAKSSRGYRSGLFSPRNF